MSTTSAAEEVAKEPILVLQRTRNKPSNPYTPDRYRETLEMSSSWPLHRGLSPELHSSISVKQLIALLIYLSAFPPLLIMHPLGLFSKMNPFFPPTVK